MATRLISLLLLLSLPTLAQQPVYKDFEIDSTATPTGGMALLYAFLQTNLRKPTAVEAEGAGGRVILTGVVEPNGHISDVRVMKGLRPDLDREAVRAFSLYNAWKPGKKGKQTVRQVVTIPVMFPKNEPFPYQNGARISYFDTNSKAVKDSTQAQYKQVTPVDSAGLPSGEIVVYKASRKDWKEEFRLPVVRQPGLYMSRAGKPVYLIGHQNSNFQWEGKVLAFDGDGNRVQESYYQDGKRVGGYEGYYPSGMVAEKNEPYNDKELITTWYPNGQIREIRTVTKRPDMLAPETSPDLITAFWDGMGQQTVKEGNGRMVSKTTVKSYGDANQSTVLTEEGNYQDGVKNGTWTGGYQDGSFFYEEEFDKGVLKKGKSVTGNIKAADYTVIEEKPMFKGGLDALGKFLSNNLVFPTDAQRARVQGKVLLTFVINTDGSVDDIKVEKGLGFGTEEEAVRVVKASKGRWTPGVQRGQKVRTTFNLPINFNLQ